MWRRAARSRRGAKPLSDIFSPDALGAQIKKLDTLPAEQAGVGLVAENGDVGIVAAGSKTLGKGWSVRGSLAYMKDAGYSAAAWLGWKGKE